MAGGGSSRTDDGKKKARIEIIPLIDVIFFLLATFVLFTLSLDRIKMLDLNLPFVCPAPPSEEQTVFIQASDEGRFYWKQGGSASAELISAAEIPVRLSLYKSAVRVPRVLIRG